jgi:hypothetical protein
MKWTKWNKNFWTAHISIPRLLMALGVYIQMYRGCHRWGSNLRANLPLWPPGQIPAPDETLEDPGV